MDEEFPAPPMRFVGAAGTSALADAAHWARGCGKCACGLLDPPPLTGRTSLFSERGAQAAAGVLKFCDCRAGQNAAIYYNGAKP